MPRRTRGLQPPTTRQYVTIANVAVVVCCCAFVWLHMQPHLLLRNTTAAGGDMGAHVWGPAYLRDTLLADGRLTGWTMDWYDGFPAFTFYFPLPSLMIALLSFLVPYGIAFKLITVLGVVSLPAAAAAFAVLSGMRRPYAACLAVATVPFLFDRGWTIYGGNVGSTLAGEFSFSISLSFALVFLGVLARSLDTGRHRGWAIVLLGCTALCHILPTIFAIVAAAVMVLIFPRVKRFALAATVGVLGLAFTGFWLVPFAVRLPLTNDMGWEKIERYGLPLVGRSLGGPEESLLWLSLPVAVAVAVYAAFVLRSRWYVAAGAAVGVGALLAGLGVSDPIIRAFRQEGTAADLTAIGQSGLDPLILRLLFYAAFAGAVVSLVRGRRLGTILTFTAVMSAVAFRFMPGPSASDPDAAGKLWNARMLPFWYLCLYLLAACLVAEMALGIIAVWRRHFRAPDVETLLEADEHARQGRMIACLSSAAGLPGGPSMRLGADSLETRAADMHEQAAGYRAVPQILVPAVAAFIVLGLVALPFGHSWFDQPKLGLDLQTSPTYIDDWAKWNYVGFEGTGDGPQRTGEKSRKVEYFEVVNMMKRLGHDRGCGRAMWEYEPELDAMGTPMALMLLPYWTDSCIGSSEGLYFESSPTTAAHFLKAGSVSKSPSNPQRGLPYTPLDLKQVGIPRMQLMGDRYYMAISPDAQKQADADDRLHLVTQSQPHQVRYSDRVEERTWKVYEVKGSELVEPLRTNPVVVSGVPESERAWKALAMKGWFADPARSDVFLASSGPKGWARVRPPPALPADDDPGRRFCRSDSRAKDVGGLSRPDPEERFCRLGAEVDLPHQAIERPPVVSGIRSGNSTLEFDVDQVGVPVLVKVSYFPNWRVKGGSGPYRVTPNFMVVVPTAKHVELSYGYTWAEGLGWVLTLGALAGAVALNRRRADTGPLAWRPDVARLAWRLRWPSSGGGHDAAAEPDGPLPVHEDHDQDEDEDEDQDHDEERVLAPVGSRPLEPEGDPKADQPEDGPRDAPGDRGPGGAQLLDGDRQLGGGEPGPLGAEHQLGVEQVGAEPACGDDGDEGRPAHRLHPVGVADTEAEAVAKDEREDGGHDSPGDGALVVGPGAALGAHHDDGPPVSANGTDGGVQEGEVGVVDVEVDDDLTGGGQEPDAQRPPVVGLG